MSRTPISALASGTIQTLTTAPTAVLPLVAPYSQIKVTVVQHGTDTPLTVYEDETTGATLTQPVSTAFNGAIPGWLDVATLAAVGADLQLALPGGTETYALVVPGMIGGVNGVNGHVGNVTLSASDVGADAAGAASAAQTAAQAHADSVVSTEAARAGGAEAAIVASAPALPEAFGAVGNGTTDDTSALESWIASGRHVALTAGKTYLHRRPLFSTTAGQKLDGKGATLKAVDQVSTTTTDSITSGVTSSITVASTSGLQVGDYITVEQPGPSGFSTSTNLSVDGTLVTSIPTNPLAGSSGNFVINSGVLLTLVSGSHAQTVITSAGAHGQDTSISIYPTILGFAFPSGTSIQEYGQFDTLNHRIQSISGNVITIADTFGITLSGTTNVHHCVPKMVFITADDVEMSGFTLHGGAVTWSRWSSHGGILTSNFNNAYVHHNHLLNVAGDALETNASTNATFAFNHIDSPTGRGFSFGSSSGPTADNGNKVIYNHFINCETDPLAGAADHHGAINYSQGGNESLVHGNLIDGGMIGIGGLNGPAAQAKTTISNNFIQNCYVSAIEVVANGQTGSCSGIIHHNIIDTCGPISIQQQSGNTGSTGWQVDANLFLNSLGVLVAAASQIKVTNNQLVTTATSGTGILFTSTGSVGVTYASIRGNLVWGYKTGVSVGSSCHDVDVDDNRCYGQTTTGVNIATGTNPAVINVQATRNRVVASSAAISSYEGINCTGTADVEFNKVDLRAATSLGAGSAGIRIRPTFSAIITCRNNIIKIGSSGAIAPVVIDSGITGTILQNNVMDAMYSDSGTSTVKNGNQVSSGPRSGFVTLVAGAATISTPELQNNSDVLLLERHNPNSSTAFGAVTKANSVIAGVSVDIKAYKMATPGTVETGDLSTIGWMIDH